MKYSFRGYTRYIVYGIILLFFLPSCAVSQKANPPVVKLKESRRVALMPMDNLSGERKGLEVVFPLVRKTLEEKGLQVIPDAKVEEFLARGRIRDVGQVSVRVAKEMGRELEADFILVGSVDSFVLSDNPKVGLSARLISAADGSILWARSLGQSGEDFTRPLGLGTIRSPEELARVAVNELFQSLTWEAPSGPRALKGPGILSRLFGLSLRAYRREGFQISQIKAIAVLPFENASRRREAGRVVANILVSELWNTRGINVIEPGEVRERMISLRIRAMGEIELEGLKKLGEALGADVLILGRVHAYDEGVERGAPFPRVEISARALYTRTGQILWMARNSHAGEDFQIAMDWGKVRSVITLTQKTLREMLETL